MISKIKIYGERCSGTNYLENLIEKNFNVEILHQYGFKHFFGFHNLENSDNTLFICIFRNYFTWLNSLYNKKWHISPSQRTSIHHFLHSEHWSYYDDIIHHKNKYGNEILEDRHIYTNERYKNILELRYIKYKWMIETLPQLVKHSLFIRYEDLIINFNNTMLEIHKKGVPLLSPLSFPKNVFTYKNSKNKKYIPKKYHQIKKKEIENHPYFQKEIEKKLLYIE